MSQEHALAHARVTAEQLSDAAGLHQHRQRTDLRLKLLTPRERDVAMLVERGISNRQIASELVIADQTVEAHVKYLLSKLGLASRYQIRDWTDRHGRPRTEVRPPPSTHAAGFPKFT